jgi:hypothetical protein
MIKYIEKIDENSPELIKIKKVEEIDKNQPEQ